MKWMRYQHKWAWGNSKEWEWVQFDETAFKADDEKSIHEFIREMELCKEGEWSEKYRGITYEFLDKPDETWLRAKIQEINRQIDGLTKHRQLLVGLLPASSEVKED